MDPAPLTTAYASAHTRWMCGDPPHTPSAAGQSYTRRPDSPTPPGRGLTSLLRSRGAGDPPALRPRHSPWVPARVPFEPLAVPSAVGDDDPVADRQCLFGLHRDLLV